VALFCADPGAADASAGPTVAQDPAVADIEKELAAMKARIAQLEAELKSRTAATQPAVSVISPHPHEAR
jgi:uncharacterized small protein (DUF1192 family)